MLGPWPPFPSAVFWAAEEVLVFLDQSEVESTQANTTTSGWYRIMYEISTQKDPIECPVLDIPPGQGFPLRRQVLGFAPV